jgi:hypothetical protein
MAAHEGTEQFTHTVITNGVAGTDAQLARQRRRFTFATATAKLRVPLQQLLRERQQFSTARIQAKATTLARKQRRIQLPLHFRQRHAGGRLGQVQALGRRTHAAVQGDLHKHIELARADIDHQ